MIFQRDLGVGENRGRWKDRAQQHPGRRPKPLRLQAQLRSLENGALERQGAQTPQPPCSTAKDSRGHPAPARSQRAGHLWGTKPQVSAKPLCLSSPLFRLGGHGEHLERGEARLGQREYRSGRTGNGTADLPPAAAPRSQAIQL